MKYLKVTYKFVSLLFSGLCIGLVTGCTDEQAVEGPDSGAMSEIHFQTSAFTRADGTNLESGGKVHVYPYHQKTGVTVPIISGGKAYTVSGADLVPEGSGATAMLIPSGTFGFYAVSTNSASETVPTFDTTAENGIPFKNENNTNTGNENKGVAIGLKNGVDYLFASATQNILFGDGQDIALKFKHVTTQVQLTIVFSETACAASADAAKNFANATVHIQQTSTDKAYMRLYDGQIRFENMTGTTPVDCGTTAASLSTSSMLSMAVDKETATAPTTAVPVNQIAICNMMPLKESSGQKMWIRVVIEGLKVGDETNATTHTYTGELEAANGWKAGESNRYTLTLSGGKVSFSGATVQPWVTGSSGGEVGNLTDGLATN
ncbi:MAG: fimbrillin family protein [Parabacteroides sp.]|nr:fimbrillin family protein [Parabacteroides sp.]